MLAENQVKVRRRRSLQERIGLGPGKSKKKKTPTHAPQKKKTPKKTQPPYHRGAWSICKDSMEGGLGWPKPCPAHRALVTKARKKKRERRST